MQCQPGTMHRQAPTSRSRSVARLPSASSNECAARSTRAAPRFISHARRLGPRAARVIRLEYTHTVHEASRRQTKQRHILGALRAAQRRLLANVSALAEIRLAAARETLDASVGRFARFAAEQDASRMHTVGERSRAQRRAISDVVQPYDAPFDFWGSAFIEERWGSRAKRRHEMVWRADSQRDGCNSPFTTRLP